MSVIIQRVFSDGADQALTLSQEELARRLNIGTNWNSIRILVQLALNCQTGANISSTSLVIGMCSGAVNTFGQGTCTNFIGGVHTQTGAGLYGQWNYNAGAGNPYYTTAGNNVAVRAGTGAASVYTVGGNNGFVPIAANGTARRGIFGCRISKGSPTFAIGNQFTGVNQDYTVANFFDYADQLANVPAGMSEYPLSVTFNEVAGALDTVNIWWPRIYPLEIYAVAVCRLS